jgi:hypothetical protein
MSVKNIKIQLKKVYPKGKISLWYCQKRKCDFISSSTDDAASHAIRLIGFGNHETKLFIRIWALPILSIQQGMEGERRA